MWTVRTARSGFAGLVAVALSVALVAGLGGCLGPPAADPVKGRARAATFSR